MVSMFQSCFIDTKFNLIFLLVVYNIYIYIYTEAHTDVFGDEQKGQVD